MEFQKHVNLLNELVNESLKCATKWFVIQNQNTSYRKRNENDGSTKFKTKLMKSSLSDYSDAYILVTGVITATNVDEDTNAAFKNCAPFTECITHISDKHIDAAENLDIAMPMHNLIQYSDNYSDTSRIIWQSKRDKSRINNAGNTGNAPSNNSSPFKYKSNILGKPVTDEVFQNVKIALPLKYLSNFLKSLEMPLINCKNECAKNPEKSLATKIGKNIPCRYSMSKIWAFDHIRSILISWGRMYNFFFQYLREHAENLIDFENKKMLNKKRTKITSICKCVLQLPKKSHQKF